MYPIIDIPSIRATDILIIIITLLFAWLLWYLRKVSSIIIRLEHGRKSKDQVNGAVKAKGFLNSDVIPNEFIKSASYESLKAPFIVREKEEPEKLFKSEEVLSKGTVAKDEESLRKSKAKDSRLKSSETFKIPSTVQEKTQLQSVKDHGNTTKIRLERKECHLTILKGDESSRTSSTIQESGIQKPIKPQRGLLPKESNVVTTIFETSVGNFQKEICKDIKDELNHWSTEGKVVCFEIGWAMPERFRDRKLEHMIRETIKHHLIASKWDLSNTLSLEPIPSSVAEECTRKHENGLVGMYRYHTPAFSQLPHFEARKEHSSYWQFEESMNEACEKFTENLRESDTPCRICINIMCVKY